MINFPSKACRDSKCTAIENPGVMTTPSAEIVEKYMLKRERSYSDKNTRIITPSNVATPPDNGTEVVPIKRPDPTSINKQRTRLVLSVIIRR